MKTSKIKINYPIFKIVGDGGFSDPSRGEGRFYPTLIIDVGDNSYVEELFKLHKDTPSGDTSLIWARPNTFFKPKTVVLSIEFMKPMQISFGIEFDIKNQYSLIDGIIQQRGVILMNGKAGNKVAELIDKSIIAEVPHLDFDHYWNNILHDTLKDAYKKIGVSRNDMKSCISEHIKSMRGFWNIRRNEL